MLSLTQLAGGFEKLLARLPGSIRKPVEQEWRPIQELFLRRRAARILVLGEPSAAAMDWLRGLFQMGQGKTETEIAPWLKFSYRGMLEFAVVGNQTAATEAIRLTQPDLVLFAAGKTLVDFAPGIPSLPVVFADASKEQTLAAIAQALPLETRLEFARMSGEKVVQREIAAMLTRSATAVCTAIGTQPIPLADFPLLTSIQGLMVAGIVHATGREWGTRLAREFITALGANIGVALVLREGARAAFKLLPGWGNAISGAIAGAGTYAVGRAASAYFIDGLPMTEARRQFKFFKKKKRPPQLRG